jgi:hypothetical protein
VLGAASTSSTEFCLMSCQSLHHTFRAFLTASQRLLVTEATRLSSMIRTVQLARTLVCLSRWIPAMLVVLSCQTTWQTCLDLSLWWLLTFYLFVKSHSCQRVSNRTRFLPRKS